MLAEFDVRLVPKDPRVSKGHKDLEPNPNRGMAV